MTDPRIRVRVKVLPWFSEILAPGQYRSVVVVEDLPVGSSLRSLLARFAARYGRFEQAIYDPKRDAMRETVVITHNGRLVSPAASLDLVLQSGDTVALIPAYPGG